MVKAPFLLFFLKFQKLQGTCAIFPFTKSKSLHFSFPSSSFLSFPSYLLPFSFLSTCSCRRHLLPPFLVLPPPNTSCCRRVQITATTPPKSPSSPSPLSLTTRHDDPVRLLLLRFFSGCFFSATTVSDAESSRVVEVSKTDTPRGVSGASRSRVERVSVSDTRPTRTRRQKRRVRASQTVNISFKCCHWYSLMKGVRLGKERRTSPLVWLAATICAVLAFAVIITGIVVFVVYMVYQPQMPYIKVTYAKLLALQYDQSGLLETQMILNLEAENDNAKAHASFSGVDFTLQFHQSAIANLRTDPFDVPNNSSHTLNYVVDSSPIPLDRSGMAEVDSALKKNRIFFELVGQARTQWRVGALVSVKFWAHINCQLQFIPSNGTNIGLHCSSKSR